MDRRKRRTRRFLAQALQELIIEKSYETITVQDITDRADLNRATFYLHYTSKEELLGDFLETQFDTLVQRIEEESGGDVHKDLTISVKVVFEHAAAYADLYKVLLGPQGQGLVMHRILNYMARHDEQWLAEEFADQEITIPIPILARHFAGSLFSCVTWWLENDMPYSIEYMADVLQKMCLTAVVPMLVAE
jgi:AcrR family transcriptional regulator